jgi:hypothetical protein
MHLLPALWNAVHCMKKTFGMEISRLPSGTWNAFALTVPEEEITVRVEVLHMSKDHKYGTFRGEFFDGSGNLLATFMNNFVATKLI